MFVTVKLAGALLLPPGLFILLLALGLVLLRYGKRKAAAALFLAVAALLCLLSLEPVKDALILPLENRYSPLDERRGQDAEMIVILGGAIIDASPETGGRATLSPAALKRFFYGARLHKKLGLPVLAAGGSPRRNSESEARVAARTLRELGVPADMILEEGTSRNTWENAAAVKRDFSPEKVILVTSAYHMPRSVLSFRKHAVACLPAPTDYRSRRDGYTFLSFIPSLEELADAQRALREYAGLLSYLCREMAVSVKR